MLAGIEIKASATVTGADFRGLRKLKEASGKRFVAGVVLLRWRGMRKFRRRNVRGSAPHALGNNLTSPSLLMISWWIIV